MGMQMFRAMCLAALILTAAAPAQAAGHHQLIRAGETMRLVADGTETVAFHKVEDGLIRLTILLTDAEGESYWSRVSLAPGQTHTIVTDGWDGAGERRFVFTRIGDAVEAVLFPMPSRTTLAAR